jgi:hypothetical protein
MPSGVLASVRLQPGGGFDSFPINIPYQGLLRQVPIVKNLEYARQESNLQPAD